jgi:hypothetical protein
MSDFDNVPVGDTDPRLAPFEVSPSDVSDSAVEGLIDEYCFRYHGLNETASPDENRDRVRQALKKGALVIWFNPAENTASLDLPPRR